MSDVATDHSRRRFIAGAVAAALSLALPVRRSCASDDAKRPKRILIVATNVARVGTHDSGTFLMEIAYPFGAFVERGYAVDVVTPKGGKAALYDNGKVADDLRAIAQDPRFVTATQHTLASRELDAARYDGIYYPGGHGQFWDVVDDARIAATAAAIHARGGVVGSAGHGTASLANVRNADGSWFVAGKRMTCFPTWAEHEYMEISDYGKLLPFDMQQVLAARKADLVLCTKETRKQKELTLIVDAPARLVTGSFAPAAGEVAMLMHERLVARGA